VWRPWSRGDAPRPPVVVITLDTTRVDHVGAADQTPALARFLAQATRFRRARTTVPLTLPAHLSLLSGLCPPRHGIHENLAPRLPDTRGFTLLAEEFRDAGYATAGFVSSAVLGDATGIAAGFEHFESPSFGEPWSDEQGDVLAPDRVAAALRWLGGRPADRPFFLWVHFFDPHVPYLPFEGDAERAGTSDGDAPAALYAGEVRRMDAAVARLLAALPDDAIVVIASDHGEGLGDHGEDTHGVLCYGETADIFLAVRAGALEAGAVDDTPRSLIDVAPSLRAWCGLAAQPADGALLTAEPDRVLVTESLLSYRTYGWGQVFAATDGRFSLVESGPRVALFDRGTDPKELTPLDPIGHPAYERLDRALHAYRAGGSTDREPDGPYFSAGSPYGHAVRPLSQYLTRPENAKLADPQLGFRFRDRMSRAKHLIYTGFKTRNADQLRAAVKDLEALAGEDPDNPAPQLYLTQALGRLGAVTGDPQWNRAAAEAARASIRLGYRVAPLLHDLLYESLQGGALEDLRAALEIAARGDIVPDLQCAELVVRSGLVLAAEGDRDALPLARRVLDRCERALADEAELRRLAELRGKITIR
jgi:arylsulfatase A-like enzyme